MRGQFLARDAAIDAEPASAIAGASSRGRIAMREQPHRSRAIATELLGVVAGSAPARPGGPVASRPSWRSR